MAARDEAANELEARAAVAFNPLNCLAVRADGTSGGSGWGTWIPNPKSNPPRNQ